MSKTISHHEGQGAEDQGQSADSNAGDGFHKILSSWARALNRRQPRAQRRRNRRSSHSFSSSGDSSDSHRTAICS
jgi:hypothetical protein